MDTSSPPSVRAFSVCSKEKSPTPEGLSCSTPLFMVVFVSATLVIYSIVNFPLMSRSPTASSPLGGSTSLNRTLM